MHSTLISGGCGVQLSFLCTYMCITVCTYVYLYIRNMDGGPAGNVFITCDVNGRKYIVSVVESAAVIKLLECQIEDDMNLVSIARESHEISGVMAVPVEVRREVQASNYSFPISCGPYTCTTLCTYVCTVKMC